MAFPYVLHLQIRHEHVERRLLLAGAIAALVPAVPCADLAGTPLAALATLCADASPQASCNGCMGCDVFLCSCCMDRSGCMGGGGA